MDPAKLVLNDRSPNPAEAKQKLDGERKASEQELNEQIRKEVENEIKAEVAAVSGFYGWGRSLFFCTSAGLVVIGIAAMVLWGATQWVKIGFLVCLFLSLISMALAYICAGYVSIRRHFSEARERDRDRDQLLSKLDPSQSYFGNMATLNWKSLQAQYVLVEQQCRRSFIASLSVGLAGFGLIVAGLTIGLTRQNQNLIVVASTASGVLTEFISGVFFFLFTRTVSQMRAYHGALVDVQNVLLSVRIVETVVAEKRSEILSDVVKQLMNRRTNLTESDQTTQVDFRHQSTKQIEKGNVSS